MLVKVKGSPFYYTKFQRGSREFSRSTGCTSEREARKAETDIIAKVEQKLALAKEINTATVIEIVTARYWKDVGQHHSGSHNTERDLARLVEYFGEGRTLDSITHVDVQNLIAWRRGHNVPRTKRLLTPATVNRSTTEMIKKLFTYEKRRGAVFKNEPNWKALILKEPVERIRELQADERNRLHHAMRSDYEPIFSFALASGLRQHECRTLRWSEVDWDTKTIRRTGKAGKAITVPITTAIRAILFPLQGHHPEYVFTFVATRTIGKFIKGRRYLIMESALKAEWRRMCRRAGVTNLRFHDMRHDFATKLLRKKKNLKLVQKALNHSDLKTTSKYAHVLDDEVRDGIEEMGERGFTGAVTQAEQAEGTDSTERTDDAKVKHRTR